MQAKEAEERAARAERLAKLKQQEADRERRLHEMLERINEAERRARDAERRARDAVIDVAKPSAPIDIPAPLPPEPEPDPIAKLKEAAARLQGPAGAEPADTEVGPQRLAARAPSRRPAGGSRGSRRSCGSSRRACR